MSLIEGVGDEVTQFMIVVLCLSIIILAWVSTGSRPDRYRTVVIMGDPRRGLHRTIAVSIRRRRLAQNNYNSIQNTEAELNADRTQTPPNTPAEPSTDEPMNEIQPEYTLQPVRHNNDNVDQAAVDSVGEGSEQIREMNQIVNAMDAMDVNVLRNRRLNFFQTNSNNSNVTDTSPQMCVNVDTPPSRGDERPGINLPRNLQKIIDQHPEGNQQLTSHDEQLSSQMNDSVSDCSQTNVTVIEQVNNISSEDVGSSKTKDIVPDISNIIIKIKYLNDTMKIVQASLSETLKDFKLRNFSKELSSPSLKLRLIFKGRVLSEDNKTLSDCGLYSDCVIHCLTHAVRNINRQQEESNMPYPPPNMVFQEVEVPTASNRNNIENNRSWDLENVLMMLISIALTIVWFCRCEYSSLFSVSASVALFGLTIIYSIAVFGLYLSDTFHLNDRRPQQTTTAQQQT